MYISYGQKKTFDKGFIKENVLPFVNEDIGHVIA